MTSGIGAVELDSPRSPSHVKQAPGERKAVPFAAVTCANRTDSDASLRIARSRSIRDLDPCERLARWAAASLVGEARLTPKPGLVDRRNTGAHHDMDLDTFLASATALEPCFHAYAAAGARLGGDDPARLASELRSLGIEGERAMFSATGGINTHKGANFAFALILGSCGAHLSQTGSLPCGPCDTDRVLELVRAMGACLLDTDIRDLLARARQTGDGSPTSGSQTERSNELDAGVDNLSHGERIYLRSGLAGARGEAARGYPLLAQKLLPYLRNACPASQDRQFDPVPDAADSLLRALVALMAELEDTNVVHRGGLDALAAHRAFCNDLEKRAPSAEKLRVALEQYDDELIAANISPGGAADLLSLGIFFALTEGLFTLDALRYQH